MHGHQALRGRLRIGVDLGGTKIEAIALDDAGRERARERIATPREHDGTVRAIAGLVTHIAKEVPATDIRVGVGTPGSLSPATGLLRNANSVWLNDRPLGQSLSDALGHPARFANDANCFARSEAADGAGRGAESVFGIIIGTGVGGGLIHRDELIRGANGIAGEWGHVPLPSPQGPELPGRACWCGRHNCLETWLSGPALARDYQEATGTAATAKDVVEAAEAGVLEARAAIDRYCDRMGRALGTIINIFDPEVIVLGGGLSNAAFLYERLPEAVRPHVFSDVIQTRIVQNQHGDSSGVRGAAWLWPAMGGTYE
ncbi:MAG: ROK family protein [Pseudomonadota bacterium]